jgi:hypothetical protein
MSSPATGNTLLLLRNTLRLRTRLAVESPVVSILPTGVTQLRFSEFCHSVNAHVSLDC